MTDNSTNQIPNGSIDSMLCAIRGIIRRWLHVVNSGKFSTIICLPP